MLAYYYNRNYLITEVLWRQPKFIVHKSLKRPPTTIMRVESLDKEATVQFIQEYYQITM